jgi:peptide/nickel transport system permease protein
MLGYVLRRLLWSIPTLLGITLLSFALLRAAHADPLLSRLRESGQVQLSAAKLDRPWYVQYAKLVGRLVTFDLGTRWQDGRPIREVLAQALPISALLLGSALGLAYAIAVPLGVCAAMHRRGRFDRVSTLSVFVLYSLPPFWVGTLLLTFLASGRFVSCPGLPSGGCFPLQGWHSFGDFAALSWPAQLLDVAWHMILPIVTLSCPAVAALSRYLRSGMLDVLHQDYIRTARAKGLPERAVVWGHALRNGVLPLVTLLGLELPQLIGGAVVVEAIFGIHGLGSVMLEAMRVPDYPVVIALVSWTAVLSLLGSLLADLTYGWLDPRVRTALFERKV